MSLRYLYVNFKKKFGGRVVVRDLLIEVAKATYIQAWEKRLNELFYPKCYVLMNNISESFNSTILQVRDKPILTMC